MARVKRGVTSHNPHNRLLHEAEGRTGTNRKLIKRAKEAQLHALAYATKLAPTLPKEKVLLVNLSGRGDKDLHIVAEAGGLEFFCRASCREATLEYRQRHAGER